MTKKEVKWDKVCWLYWIRRKSHTDILTEGYIGISINPHERFTEHRRCLRKDAGKNYRTDFKNAYEEDDLIYELLLKSTQEYCMAIERKLRPSWCIGWNIAAGGSGGTGSHGWSKTPYYDLYKGVKVGAKARKLSLCESWVGENGVENFANFYITNVPEGYELQLPRIGEISPLTVKVSTRKEITNEMGRKYQLEDGGIFYSLTELGEKLGIKPSTISCRMKRGKSLRVACYLEDPCDGVVLEDGRIIPYRGKLSEDDFRSLVKDYENGESIPDISRKYSIDASMVSRLGSNYGISRRSRIYVTFLGKEKMLSNQSSLTVEDYNFIKKELLRGKKCSELAREFMLDYSTMHAVLEKLEWKKYSDKEKDLQI